jgi:hypothetical protein
MTGKPATRANISRSGPARLALGTQDGFQKLDKRGLFRHRVLSHGRVEIGNRAQPQLATQLGQALVLQVAHQQPPAKTSYSDRGCWIPTIAAGAGLA